ncbi:hypothetical protein B1750_gp256 [Noumeavirus]|uniref:Uncharacterized protein n=1 Tax=Marseillevirus sp. TaxID=2809551 RepID=A0AA96EMP9_9VIRU|nr:hypothetical protein B1750_gp256 [Noumeavirus]AQM73237.1 hypothetical protein NMV_256 [Noumeavirus]AQQ73650.1 hypothetical protein [Kurlavirus BKC-1]QZX43754.1 hypothetical protein MarQu_172 [Marseillevirus sp.]WNL50305.1 hypothetical protein MarDSR_266 [Marseillevirus sp.]
MFWKWSCVLTDKGDVDFCELSKGKYKLVLEDSKICEFRLVKERHYEIEYIVFQVKDKEFFVYATRFTRFFLGEKEVYAFELKKGDVLEGRDCPVMVKEHRKVQNDVEVYKILISEDKAFFVDGIKVKKS